VTVGLVPRSSATVASHERCKRGGVEILSLG
jgi:hypothetical protein